MTDENVRRPALLFNGSAIRDRAEQLNLTDMWKAAGADLQQQPAKWRELPSTRAFVEHVAEVILGKTEDEMFRTVRGGRSPATWAHWQIGLAYAKYLSPEFHAWCNTVVRERMEGRPPAGEVDEITRRMDGILRMLSHKTAGLEKSVEAISSVALSLAAQAKQQEARIEGLIIVADGRAAVVERKSMRDILDEAKALPSGRRSLQGKMHNLFQIAALAKGMVLRKDHHSKKWLYPIDFTSECMKAFGAEMVIDHNAEVVARTGQGTLPFPKGGKGGRKKPGSQPGAGESRP